MHRCLFYYHYSFYVFSAIREELNTSTGRVLVVVVEAADLSSPKQNEGIHNFNTS